jgi:hypothetical protein
MSDEFPLGSSKKRKKSYKKEAMDHEQDLAERLGGVAQPGSGAGLRHKGDVKLDDFLLDSKQSHGNTIIVAGKDLGKIQHEATQASRVPGLVLKLEVPSNTPNEWVCIPLKAFAELIEKED